MYIPDGQIAVLHCSVSVASPLQTAPPLAAGVEIALVRAFVPVPQVAEHSVHSPKLVHVQSTAICDSDHNKYNGIINKDKYDLRKL